jgi:DNA-binding CsgD family transcriptional regulator
MVKSKSEDEYGAALGALRRKEGFTPRVMPDSRKPAPSGADIELRRVKVMFRFLRGMTAREISEDMGISYNVVWQDKLALETRGYLKCK